MGGHALPPVDHEETTEDVVPVTALMRGLAMIARLDQGARPRPSTVTIEELADEMVPPSLHLQQTVQPFAPILRRPRPPPALPPTDGPTEADGSASSGSEADGKGLGEQREGRDTAGDQPAETAAAAPEPSAVY